MKTNEQVVSLYTHADNDSTHSITSCGAPLASGCNVVFSRSLNRSILDHDPLAHLLDLIHYSRRVAKGGQKERSSSLFIFLFWVVSVKSDETGVQMLILVQNYNLSVDIKIIQYVKSQVSRV